MAKNVLHGLWLYEVFRGITPGKGRFKRVVKNQDFKGNVVFPDKAA
jgi:hypothetical protein